MVSTRLEFPCLCVFGSRQSDPTGGKDAKLTWILVGMAGAATLCGVAGLIFLQAANGMSARAKPSTLEAWVARRARALAMSSEAKSLKSPVTKTPEVLAEGLAIARVAMRTMEAARRLWVKACTRRHPTCETEEHRN
jgi:hypothetical protein